MTAVIVDKMPKDAEGKPVQLPREVATDKLILEELRAIRKLLEKP